MRLPLARTAFTFLCCVAGMTAIPLQAQPLDCPINAANPQELDAWRQKAATGLADASLSDSDVAQAILRCFGTQVPQCLKRVDEFSRRYATASGRQDSTIATLEQKRPPDELKNPTATGFDYVIPENIELLAQERGWPFVRYKSRHSGGFDSDTPSLLMVYVPGDKVNPPVAYDRWLNFALPADQGENALKPRPQAPIPTLQDYLLEANGGPSLPRTFTMVTLDRKVGTDPAKVYFQKFFRSGTGSPVFQPESNSSVSDCVSCHPNGLRAISPLGFHVRDGEQAHDEQDWLAVKVINDAMITAAGNKAVSWRDAIVDSTTGATKTLLQPSAYGPVVGPVKPLSGGHTRTKEFILGGTLADGSIVEGCFKRRTKVDVVDIFDRAPGANNVYTLSSTTSPNVNWEKVSNSMKCAMCHNDVSRGSLNSLTDFDQIDFKILVDQSMPVGAHKNPLDQGSVTSPVVDNLSADERIALANCLQAEFEIEQTRLTNWLTQSACQ